MIALLEDDPDQAALLERWLARAGRSCVRFASGRSLLEAVATARFTLAVVDWGLPDLDGLEVVSRLRAGSARTLPVLLVTARDAEADIVRALELGADDYLCKPVGREVLLARVAALLAPRGADARGLDFPPFEFDAERPRVRVRGRTVELGEAQYRLALLLFRSAGRLLATRRLAEVVAGPDGSLAAAAVDEALARVRVRLPIAPRLGWRLSAVYRYGYRLERTGTASRDHDTGNDAEPGG